MIDVTEKHFVVFESPGTFFNESDTKPIGGWSVAVALEMASQITQRYNAKPFGFRFLTKLVSPPIDDGRGGELAVEPKIIRESGMHFINGKLLSLADIRKHPDYGADSVLAGNMECNHWPYVVETRNSYRHVTKFSPGDFIVTGDAKVIPYPPEESAQP